MFVFIKARSLRSLTCLPDGIVQRRERIVKQVNFRVRVNRPRQGYPGSLATAQIAPPLAHRVLDREDREGRAAQIVLKLRRAKKVRSALSGLV